MFENFVSIDLAETLYNDGYIFLCMAKIDKETKQKEFTQIFFYSYETTYSYIPLPTNQDVLLKACKGIDLKTLFLWFDLFNKHDFILKKQFWSYMRAQLGYQRNIHFNIRRRAIYGSNDIKFIGTTYMYGETSTKEYIAKDVDAYYEVYEKLLLIIRKRLNI